ncbi:hypothetical protein MJD09_25890 [bacterium]|nr:hypothetical protein [bacterium]
MAVPMREAHWFNLFEACVANGSHIILADPSLVPAQIAKTIYEEDVTVLATTSKVWPGVSNHLELKRGHLTGIRTLIFNGSAVPETRTTLIPTALSAEARSSFEDVRAVYQSVVRRNRN